MKCRISDVPRNINDSNPLRDGLPEPARGLWKRFHVFRAGNTNDAHHDFVNKLKGVGHTEVDFPEQCDYLVVFCPIASRVQTDIKEALGKKSADKPAVLVVMHHSYDPEHVVADSRRHVTDPNILTVDCLFYDDHFLKCKRNDAAWSEVQDYLGVSQLKKLVTDPQKVKWLVIGVGVVIVVVAVVVVIVKLFEKKQ